MTSGTSLTVVVPAGTGTVSVTVTTTAGGSSAPLADAYTYNAAADGHLGHPEQRAPGRDHKCRQGDLAGLGN